MTTTRPTTAKDVMTTAETGATGVEQTVAGGDAAAESRIRRLVLTLVGWLAR